MLSRHRETAKRSWRSRRARTAAGVPLGRVGTTQDRADASSCSRTGPRSSPAPSFWSTAEGWRCRERVARFIAAPQLTAELERESRSSLLGQSRTTPWRAFPNSWHRARVFLQCLPEDHRTKTPRHDQLQIVDWVRIVSVVVLLILLRVVDIWRATMDDRSAEPP
jgi:hypothetical protein